MKKTGICLTILMLCVLAIGLCGCEKTWTVSFDTNGGNIIPSQSVTNGARVQKPETPVKDGYSFLWWTCFDEKWSFVDNTVTEDLSLKAEWIANRYTISIKDGTSISKVDVIYNSPYTLNLPEKRGYTFDGYYRNGSLFDMNGIYNIADDIELSAKWRINTYTATFEAFGKIVGTTTFTVEDNVLKNLPNVSKNGCPVVWHYSLDAADILISSNTIYLGEYEQDNVLSKKEQIEWYILEEQNGKMLLLSKYGLDNIPYNTSYIATTWETSNARKWLNSTFYNESFTETEKSRIIKSSVTADKNPELDVDCGKTTEDNIFLLSAKEVDKYLSNDQRKYCPVTDFAKNNKAYRNSVNQYGMWCTRTVGLDQGHNMVVSNLGDYYHLAEVSNKTYVLRPAMWVEIGVLVE